MESSPAINPVFSRACGEFNNKNITAIKSLKTGEISIGSCSKGAYNGVLDFYVDYEILVLLPLFPTFICIICVSSCYLA